MFGVTGQIMMGCERRTRGSMLGWSVAWLAGHCLGGVAIGALLGAVGARIPENWRTPLGAALAAVTLLWAATELGWMPLKMPQWQRQVQRRWILLLPPPLAALGFGLQLGSAVMTRITSMTVYALMSCVLLSGSPAAGAGWMAVFGLARAAIPLVAAPKLGSPKAALACAMRFDRRGWLARRAGAAVLVATAGALGWTYGRLLLG
jgi:hypothetical protein